MHTIASDRTSSYMRGISTPVPFGGSSAAPRKHPSTAPASSTAALLQRPVDAPPLFNARSRSPIASLATDLDSSLHLDTSSNSSLFLSHTPSKRQQQPAVEPSACLAAASSFGATPAQTTPLLSRSRKRQMEDQSS
ncbi:hypothetical protein IWW38_006437, partial [Coemansia aciculifera]